MILFKICMSFMYPIRSKANEKGMTLVPLKLYFKNGKVKLELGLGKGKKLYDKREDAARRDAKREMDRTLKDRRNFV